MSEPQAESLWRCKVSQLKTGLHPPSSHPLVPSENMAVLPEQQKNHFFSGSCKYLIRYWEHVPS